MKQMEKDISGGDSDSQCDEKNCLFIDMNLMSKCLENQQQVFRFILINCSYLSWPRELQNLLVTKINIIINSAQHKRVYQIQKSTSKKEMSKLRPLCFKLFVAYCPILLNSFSYKPMEM